ncbi:MAG: M14 family metallopeptidase [Bacteroidota bacterium]|nr:M14 family metallopeptidase [Bacteroidota bacterium]
MKKILILSVLIALMSSVYAQWPLSYYLPKHISYYSEIPTPAEFMGHDVGEWHVTHDKLYYYMIELARISDKAIWEEYALSHEDRPLGNLIISSPENIKNLEQLRQEHLNLNDPSISSSMDISGMPVFIKLGYGVHGNESSAQNSSVLTAYYLLAGIGEEIEDLLENAVILIDPCLNPDGLQRHSTWVNMHKSINLNPDENSREFNEMWPGGRTNHYWFDLNRDYIMLQQPESVGRVAAFHRWRPNINTDHHEMGASSTFFFQPGVESRENPYTPEKSYKLHYDIARYHQKHLDNIGSLYYSEEGFDDFYFGKGSAYPDIFASIGILFEQAGVKGHLRETSGGLLSFPFAIKNQFTVSLSTLEAGLNLREKLLQLQIDFYSDVKDKAENDPVKAYVFSEPFDLARTAHFIENLLRHQIKVYRLGTDINIDGKEYKAKDSYIIPFEQAEYLYIKSMFETITEFEENVFYDISSWVLPMSFNIDYSEYRSRSVNGVLGPEIIIPPYPEGSLRGNRDAYAWLFEWKEYYTPGALYRLLDEGLKARVATEGFVYDDGEFKKNFDNGTIMVPAYKQDLDRDAIYELMKEIVGDFGITVYGMKTGYTPEGIDFGSNSFEILEKPKVLMFVGDGISSRDAGEVWHMFDQRFEMPVTMIDAEERRSLDLSEYNVLILAGNPSLSGSQMEELRSWSRKGGVIIAYKRGNSFLAANKLADIISIPPPGIEDEGDLKYADRYAQYSVHRIPGSIFQVRIDNTHPLFYGYDDETIPVFKSGSDAVKKSDNVFANPAVYTEDPLLSGYSSDENIERIVGSAFCTSHSAGRGTIISIYDNTNFRAIWFGTSKIFMNAVFFGQIL